MADDSANYISTTVPKNKIREKAEALQKSIREMEHAGDRPAKLEETRQQFSRLATIVTELSTKHFLELEYMDKSHGFADKATDSVEFLAARTKSEAIDRVRQAWKQAGEENEPRTLEDYKAAVADQISELAEDEAFNKRVFAEFLEVQERYSDGMTKDNRIKLGMAARNEIDFLRSVFSDNELFNDLATQQNMEYLNDLAPAKAIATKRSR